MRREWLLWLLKIVAKGKDKSGHGQKYYLCCDEYPL